MTLSKRRYWILGLMVITSLAVAAVTIAANGGDDQPITGPALEKCTAAALAENPGGTVTETEVDDDGAATYEVEVRLADGSQVEVHLDKNCVVTGQEADDDGPNDD